MDVFNKCINMVGGAEPRHCIAFMRLLNNSMANIHRFCPEEQKLIGEEAVSRVTADLKAVCTAVTTLMSTSLNIRVSYLMHVYFSYQLSFGRFSYEVHSNDKCTFLVCVFTRSGSSNP